jgi:Cytochrome b
MEKQRHQRLLVWTLPTRLFHWAFGTCITLALLSGEGIISMSMEQHMWVGGTALALILFRIVWGFLAGDYARFDRFSLNIFQLPNYAVQLFRRAPKPHAGHSPAGSWSVMLILTLTLTQAITGLMTSDAIFTEGPLVPFVDNNMVNLGHRYSSPGVQTCYRNCHPAFACGFLLRSHLQTEDYWGHDHRP